MPPQEEVLDALDDLVTALRENSLRNERVIQRAEEIRKQRAAGIPWSQIASTENRPLIVEAVTQNMATLGAAGGRLRRLEAQALHAEGLSMDRIAALFGVSRQRISELLRPAPGAADRQ